MRAAAATPARRCAVTCSEMRTWIAQPRTATPFTADFQDLITRYAWGEIWTRPGLDERSRRILVLGTLIALGRLDEFRMHARAALDHGGFSQEDLKEIVLQQAIYCGVPAANSAFEACVREVVRELDESESEDPVGPLRRDAGHQPHQRVLGGGGAREFSRDPPFAQHDDARAEVQHFRQARWK